MKNNFVFHCRSNTTAAFHNLWSQLFVLPVEKTPGKWYNELDKSEFVCERKVEVKKALCIVFAMILFTFTLVGCNRYSSHYNAVGHVCSTDSDSAWMSFVEFDGNEVFKLKCKSNNQAEIVYSGKIETGSLTVYYDCGGTKKELFSLQSGDDIQSAGRYLPEDTIYIIVETSEKCSNGNLSFKVIYG